MPKYAKGHNYDEILWNLFKSLSGNLLIIPYQLTKFQPLIYFLRNLADKLEMPKFAKGHNSGNIWRTLFKS